MSAARHSEPRYRVDVWNFYGDIVHTQRSVTWDEVEEIQRQYLDEPYEVVFEELS